IYTLSLHDALPIALLPQARLMPVAQIRRSNCLKVAFMILRKPIPSNVSGGTEERQATVYQPASSNKERNLAESGLYQIVKGLAPNSTFHSANRQGPWGASPRRRESLRPCSALILAEHANHTPLHLHVRGRYDDRRHLRIGGLQPDFPRAFAIKPLQRGFFSADKREHNVSCIGDLGLLAHHIVAVHDVILDHRIALHLQHEGISSSREITERNRLPLLHGFEGTAGGDPPHERKLLHLALNYLFFHGLRQLHNFDRTALVISAPDKAILLQRGDVLVDGRERGQLQALANLFEAGSVAVLGFKGHQVVQDFLLPFCKGHAASPFEKFSTATLGEKKANVKQSFWYRCVSHPFCRWNDVMLYLPNVLLL